MFSNKQGASPFSLKTEHSNLKFIKTLQQSTKKQSFFFPFLVSHQFPVSHWKRLMRIHARRAHLGEALPTKVFYNPGPKIETFGQGRSNPSAAPHLW